MDHIVSSLHIAHLTKAKKSEIKSAETFIQRAKNTQSSEYLRQLRGALTGRLGLAPLLLSFPLPFPTNARYDLDDEVLRQINPCTASSASFCFSLLSSNFIK